jgi:taurine--2-oxoglutarate transaminase
MAAVLDGCVSRGMVPFVNFNRVRLVPPLTISPDQLTGGIGILDAALTSLSLV